MDVNECALALSAIAMTGDPNQKREAEQALGKLKHDTETNADPDEDMGVPPNASEEELASIGLRFEGGLLVLEMDAARKDQDEHDTIKRIEEKNPPKLCSTRLMMLRSKVLRGCNELHPDKPWFYHALLTLAYVRRNTKVLRRKFSLSDIYVTPACSLDDEKTTYYDDFDLLDELEYCNFTIQVIWDQLMNFYERLRTREFEVQPLDEEERKWCGAHDAELRRIFLFIRQELRTTNPVEFRAVWEMFRSGQLDFVELRKLWRCEQPHQLSFGRAKVLLEILITKKLHGNYGFNGMYTETSNVLLAFCNLVAFMGAVDGRDVRRGDASDEIKLEFERQKLIGIRSHQDDFKIFGERMFLPALTSKHCMQAEQYRFLEKQTQLAEALQRLWSACVQERMGGNRTKPLEYLLQQCMVDRDAVMNLVRKSNISIRVSESIRKRWLFACSFTEQYWAKWELFNDLDHHTPELTGGRDIAFAIWTMLRCPEQYQRVSTTNAKEENMMPFYMDPDEGCERAFLAMRCLARHSIVCSTITDSFLQQSSSGDWDPADKSWIERSQRYLHHIAAHEKWLASRKRSEEPQPKSFVELIFSGEMIPRREGVTEAQWTKREQILVDNEIALEVHKMTEDQRLHAKAKYLMYACLIMPRADLKVALSRGNFKKWAKLYEVFVKEQAASVAAAAAEKPKTKDSDAPTQGAA
jgi:hypothetical protein